jgi:butyryl-CoA dehydrogenase
MSERPIYNTSPDQEKVREAARTFGKKEILPLSQTLDRDPRFPIELYRKMAEAGFLGYTGPPEFGGAGKSWVEYATLIEELSCFDASAGFILSIGNLAMSPIELFGTEEQKRRFLPQMIRGEKIGAFALTEPGAGSDAMNLKTTFWTEGDSYIVEGEKLYISSGDVADLLVVFCVPDRAVEKRSLSALILETKDLGGLGRQVLKHKMGLRGSSTARLTFDGCRVPKSNLLGEAGQGFKIAMKSLDYSRAAIAAQAVGLGQACLDRAIGYAKKREAFGAPISNLHAIQDMVADMSTKLEAARLLTYKAAALMDAGKPFAGESAQAKLFASEMVTFVADRTLQVHGGSGYVGDLSDVEKLYRDARVIPIYEGTSEIQRMIVARHAFK